MANSNPIAQKGEHGGFAPTTPVSSPANPYAGLVSALQGSVAAGKEVAAEKGKLAEDVVTAGKAKTAAEKNLTDTALGPDAGKGVIPAGQITVTSTYTDPNTGNIVATMSDGSTRVLAQSGAGQAARQSAFDLLVQEFSKYGLQDLVTPLKGLIQQNVSPAEFSLQLKQTPAYQQRFSANADRVKAGLSELSPAEYVALEDQYQNVMRQYGLPASYYKPGQYGKQEGFDKLIANDVSSAELQDRIATAQDRVINANPEVLQQLKVYYPDITNGDVLAYALDPKNALSALKRKVTAAEIGGAAASAGLSDSAAQAEQLAAYGVTGAQAQQQYGTIAQLAQRGSQLANIYGQTPYGQTQAEQEVFNLGGQTAAQNARKKLTELEKASFSGSSGTSQNALNRDRQMSNYMLGIPGAGAF